MSRRLLCGFLAWVLMGSLAACAPGRTERPQAPAQPITLKFAALRILDALPLFVAEKQGYFTQNGIQIEIIPVASAPERDQLIAAGQADGMINEMTSTLFANRDQLTVQVVRFARSATADSPVFRILAAKDSGIASLADLQPAQTGISEGTIIQYAFERLIEAEGYNAATFGVVNIPAIPERLKLLGAGKLKAAVLPDPAASLAIQQGAIVVIDDSSHPEFGYSTIAFRKAIIDQRPEAIKAFLAAWEKAVTDINADSSQWKSLLTEQEILPAPLAEIYTIPAFVAAGVPTETQFADALAWAKAKGYLQSDLAYKDCVNAAFLP